MTNSFLHVLVAILNPRWLLKVKRFKKLKSPSDSIIKILKIDGHFESKMAVGKTEVTIRFTKKNHEKPSFGGHFESKMAAGSEHFHKQRSQSDSV